MARARASYVCQNCGAITQRWQGKCEACGEWNTIIEEAAALGVGGAVGAAGRRSAGRFRWRTSPANPDPCERIVTGIGELDRVAGGGFVPGSATLIGGEPGIGKSTLLIQACAALACAAAGSSMFRARNRPSRCACAPRASAFRARRCNWRRRRWSRISSPRSARATRRNSSSSNSIQTMWSDAIESAPGTVSQVRARRAGADPLRQGERRGGDPGRPCHQGRPDRRPARRRAHGRRGDVVRGRGRPRLPRAARDEEPLRRDRRDRRVRDDRRAGSPRSPILPRCFWPAATSRRRARRCSPASRARGRCWWRSRRSSRLRRSARRGARWSAGIPSRLAMVLAVLEAHGGLKLGQHDVYLNVAGRLADRRAGRRSRGGGGAGLLAGRRRPCRMRPSISARSRSPARCARSATRACGSRRRRSSAFARRSRRRRAARDEDGAGVCVRRCALVADRRRRRRHAAGAGSDSRRSATRPGHDWTQSRLRPLGRKIERR